MPATFHSLPPELILQILDHLPLPSFGLEAPNRSPLSDTALVNRLLRLLSQELLFVRVTLVERKHVERWSRTDARMRTIALSIRLSWRAGLSEGGVEAGWLEEALREGLAGEGGGGGAVLKVLDVQCPGKQPFSDQLYQVEGLKGLQSLATNFALPPVLPSDAPSQLQYLRIGNRHVPSPLPTLPALTHLTLAQVPLAAPAFATLFPHLVYLDLGLPSYPPPDAAFYVSLSEAMPPALEHFATPSALNDDVCRALPDRLASLTVTVWGGHDFGSVRRRWLEGREARSCSLGVLVLRTFGGYGEGEELRRLPLAQREPVMAELDAIRRTGCEVVFRRQSPSDWRGE